MPRWFIAREGEDAASSEEEEEDDTEAEAQEEEEEDSGEVEGQAGASGANDNVDGAVEPSSSKQAAKKGKISMSLSGLACHVCGTKGHNAGFVGSVYVDCPNKPCYLCKKPGHTTMTCPYRVAPDHDCTPAASAGDYGILASLLQRSHDSRRRELRFLLPEWQIDAAVLKLHARRCTCLQFHPSSDNLVISGDKTGQVAVWDHLKVYERTVWRPSHGPTNALGFLPGGGMSCCSTSGDGTLKVVDVETGFHKEVLNMNPGGWTGDASRWVMLYGMDVCGSRGLVAAGDTRGCVHFADPRTEAAIATQQLHKKGNKVNTACFSTVDPNLLVTGSNDWTARIWDIRKLSCSTASATDSKGKEVADEAMELARIEHPKVVNSAYFSPTTGMKLMTTCIDNRIRIWDYLLSVDKPPDREIVHSHDFNRYLTPFRAEWDPKDPDERLIVVGRYISEDFSGVALHPVDLFDASTGRLLHQLTDPNLTTISPVNKFHPRLDMLVSGSSSSLYAWRPSKRSSEEGYSGRTSASPHEPKSSMLQGSADYVFFDAGGGADDEKKKRRKKVAESEDIDSPPGKVKARPPSATKDKKSRAAEGRKPSKPSKAAEPKEPKGKKDEAEGKGKGKRKKK